MQAAILVATIGALATLIAATIAHFLQKRREHDLKSLQFKLDRYADFLGGFSEIGSRHKTYEAHLNIANSVNAMNLIATREVLQQVYSLFDYVGEHHDSAYVLAEQDAIIRRIIRAMRKDLGQPIADFDRFQFRTISPGGKPGEVIEN